MAFDIFRDILERGQGTLIKDILGDHLVHAMFEEEDRDGLTVLHHVAHEGNTNLLSHLIDVVADYRWKLLRGKDRQGLSVFHHAVMSDCIDVVKSVLKLESFCEEDDINGLGGLQYAVRRGNKKIANFCIKSKCHPIFLITVLSLFCLAYQKSLKNWYILDFLSS